jgi:WD40 repeat protein
MNKEHYRERPMLSRSVMYLRCGLALAVVLLVFLLSSCNSLVAIGDAEQTAMPSETPIVPESGEVAHTPDVGPSLTEDHLSADLHLLDREITALAWSPDGSYLAFGSRRIVLWNPATDDTVQLPTHEYSDDSTISSIEFSSNGTIVAASWTDGKVRAWNAKTGEVVFSADIDYGSSTLALDPGEGFLAAAKPHERFPGILVWDMRTSDLLYELHSYSARSLDIDPQGTRLAAGLAANRVVLLDLPSGNTIADIEIVCPPSGVIPIDAISFSPDGATFWVAEVGTGRLTRWDANTGQLLYSVDVPEEGLNRVSANSISRTGERVASLLAPINPVILIWDPSTGQTIYRIAPEAGRIPFRVAISPNGRQLAVGGTVGNLMLWELP